MLRHEFGIVLNSCLLTFVKFAEIFGEFPAPAVSEFWGMGEHSFPKVFPYFPFSGFYTTCHMVHTVHFENGTELNDTRCDRLATNGPSSANSKPSSSAAAKPTRNI